MHLFALNFNFIWHIMKTLSLSLAASLCVTTFCSLSHAESNGTWSCMLDGQKWENQKGGASLNGDSLTLYSGDDQIDGIYIMMSQPPSASTFPLNGAAQASFSDPQGAQHSAKDGSGALIISKFTPPVGETKGSVEGTFSGDFEPGTAKAHSLKECTFNLPVKNL